LRVANDSGDVPERFAAREIEPLEGAGFRHHAHLALVEARSPRDVAQRCERRGRALGDELLAVVLAHALEEAQSHPDGEWSPIFSPGSSVDRRLKTGDWRPLF